MWLPHFNLRRTIAVHPANIAEKLEGLQVFLQERAEDFFNAYEVLKESNETLIARLSNSADNRPDAKMFGTRPAMGVDVVCLAFSVELYIKNLHYVLTNEAPRGHNILALFNDLPEPTQREILSFHSIAKYGWNMSEFKNEIGAISDGFEKWRYSYEVTTVRYNSYFALVFVEALRSAAMDRIRLASSKN